MRETVEREADGGSVSYGPRLISTRRKACLGFIFSVIADPSRSEAGTGALRGSGPLGALSLQEKVTDWVRSLPAPDDFCDPTVGLTEERKGSAFQPCSSVVCRSSDVFGLHF